ncbi:MAG: tRNA-guanine transglycosylase DpdA [Candidatus Bathyarchaeota archaeon]|nr:tRNA-guanine transglycosylase DpdA [Candidatus Bathyarchaeota archaeon]
MKYFIPEWNDRVDPNYDFINDIHSSKHNEDPTRNDVYMWEIFGIDKVPFDGILISRIVIEQEKKRNRQIKEEGIHSALRLPKNFEIIGDCGAFGYINRKVPPYDPIEILEYYKRVGFNYGVTVDHLVVPQFVNEKDERIKITYENGVKALEEWKARYKNDFQLIVAIQGWEIADYLNMYNKYIEHGATHLAFGGLVRRPTTFVKDLLQHVILEIKRTKKYPEYVHFFGLARATLFPQLKELEELGVRVGFDSASYLRKAWLSTPTSELNYLTPNDGYTAIRIPFVGRKKLIPEIAIIKETLKDAEQKCMQEIRRYEKGHSTVDNVLSTISEFAKLNGNKQFSELYKRTLVDQPWKKCKCPICKQIGIEVVLFRGNNRNRRRGFHNVFIFYNMLKNEGTWHLFTKTPMQETNKTIELDTITKEEKVLVITGCTKKKITSNPSSKLPAHELYQGRLFKTVKKYSQMMGFDYLIISAKYGLLRPTEIIEGYEKVLRTKKDIEEIRPQVEEKLGPILTSYDKIVVIAGENYRKALKTVWDDRFFFVKAKGYGDLCSIVEKSFCKNTKLHDF